MGRKCDLQELLLISDALITDYSSSMVDYLLTMKPILLFTYDLDDYIKERGFCYNFQDVAPGPLLFNGEEFIEAIKHIDKIDIEFKEKRKKLRDMFNKFVDNKSTERICDFLKIDYCKL